MHESPCCQHGERFFNESSKMEDISSCKRRGSLFIRVLMFTAVCLNVGLWSAWRSIESANKEFTWRIFADERWYMSMRRFWWTSKVGRRVGMWIRFVDPLCEDTVNHRDYHTDHILKDVSWCGWLDDERKWWKWLREKELKVQTEIHWVNLKFNMMFKTSVGAPESEDSVTIFRPEQLRNFFTNFKNVVDSFYPRSGVWNCSQQGVSVSQWNCAARFCFPSEFEL